MLSLSPASLFSKNERISYVTIETLTGHSFALPVKLEQDTVLDLTERIEKLLANKLSRNSHCLLFKSNRILLTCQQPLSYFNIKPWSILILSVHLSTGSSSKSSKSKRKRKNKHFMSLKTSQQESLLSKHHEFESFSDKTSTKITTDKGSLWEW
eukprot:gb/GECH01003838.1/.p1 GENE.gb/GECH01003838.1/~~gb/GECH01003838.1/.p1  ORF type:complete len:154 (+),score=11.01 gb/GECH01003838.1/:1-462(+)